MPKHLTSVFIAGWLLITLAWLGNDHYPPWIGFQSEVLAFAGLYCLMASLLFNTQGATIAMPRAGFWVVLALLIVWLQFALGVSRYASDAILVSLYLTALLAAMIVGYAMANFQLLLMYSLCIAALISAVIGNLQWLGVETPFDLYIAQSALGKRAGGNLAQPNQLATLLLMGMAALAYIFEMGKLGRVTSALVLGVMTWALVLTQSRSGMLSLIAVAAFLLWKIRSSKLQLSTWAVLGWIAFFGVCVLLLPHLSEALLLTVPRSMSDAAPVSQRLEIWRQMIYAVQQSPWLGYGWPQTPAAYAVGAAANPGEVIYNYAHNVILDLLAWNGLLLGGLLVGAVIYWYVSRMRASSECVSIYAMACLIPFAVHSMLEYPFAYAFFLITAGFMVGIVDAERKTTSLGWLDKRLATVTLLLCVVVGGRAGYEYLLVEDDFRGVLLQTNKIGKPPQVQSVDVWLLTHMAAMLKASSQSVEQGMARSEIDNLRDVSSRFVYISPRCRYAVALALNGDSIGADRQLITMQGMFGKESSDSCKAELNRRQNEAVSLPALIVN